MKSCVAIRKLRSQSKDRRKSSFLEEGSIGTKEERSRLLGKNGSYRSLFPQNKTLNDSVVEEEASPNMIGSYVFNRKGELNLSTASNNDGISYGNVDPEHDRLSASSGLSKDSSKSLRTDSGSDYDFNLRRGSKTPIKRKKASLANIYKEDDLLPKPAPGKHPKFLSRFAATQQSKSHRDFNTSFKLIEAPQSSQNPKIKKVVKHPNSTSSLFSPLSNNVASNSPTVDHRIVVIKKKSSQTKPITTKKHLSETRLIEMLNQTRQLTYAKEAQSKEENDTKSSTKDPPAHSLNTSLPLKNKACIKLPLHKQIQNGFLKMIKEEGIKNARSSSFSLQSNAEKSPQLISFSKQDIMPLPSIVNL